MNELTPERCQAILDESMVAHMAVISGDEPYVSPISYVVVGDALCLRTGAGRRVDAIRQNPRVCVEAAEFDTSTGYWESVIVWGEAQVVENDSEAEEIVMALLRKYRQAIDSPLNPGSPFPEAGILLRIHIEQMSGRSSGSFFSSRTRPGRL